VPFFQEAGEQKVKSGSIGLGLATRQMSISTAQDKKQKTCGVFFLSLSLIILALNTVLPSFVNQTKQFVADQTVVAAETVFAPVHYASTELMRVKALWDVQKNNEMLAAENERLIEWFQTANRLDAENKALRELLNMKEEEAVEYHAAKVIADTATQYSHTILVRMGADDGLTKGQGVLSHEGLIGRVIETVQKTARVLLMNDVNSRIPVTIEGAQDRAILAGTNNGDPILDHLPETHTIAEGQRVITSGHGGIFPYGVPVGETYKTRDGWIAVRPFANANRANYVQIVDYGVPAGSATRSVASSGSTYLR
jgi:rod shape-determining protein MreC